MNKKHNKLKNNFSCALHKKIILLTSSTRTGNLKMKKENSTNSINDEILHNFCSAHRILSQITGRWKVSILLSLQESKKSYTDLKVVLPQITDRILSKQLRELLLDDIIVNEKNKISSFYSLTTKGHKIALLLDYINTLNLA